MKVPTSRELFQTAYESRYTWDENFPGYNADVQLVQGTSIHTGKISINRDMNVEVSGITDEQVHEGIYTQLRDIVTHRQRTSFDKSHVNHQFTQGEVDETGAVEIIVQGDTMGSNYKIRGQEICQVSRVMGRMAFIIETYESLDTGEGLIATRYNAIFRDTKTDLVTNVINFVDSYEKFGSYYLMTKQIVQEYRDGESSTTEFNYCGIQLG
jgi:hypothetical protein